MRLTRRHAPPLHIATLRHDAKRFDKRLADAKHAAAPADFPWYPYGSLSNFVHLERLLQDDDADLFARLEGGHVADIGAADGELGFFLESKGFTVDLVDHAPTNFNQLRGARLLKETLGSAVGIHEVDLDRGVRLPAARYDLVVFLGILYHLKNPFGVLESLAGTGRWCMLSTRVARTSVTPRRELRDVPVAYLLDPDEANHDSTNYWIFSEAGLRRLVARTGWTVRRFMTAGDTQRSNPAERDHDERAFLLLENTALATGSST